MKLLLAVLLVLLPCVGYPTLDRADQNVLLVAIPTHIGDRSATPPINGEPFNGMMVHVKPLRPVTEILITVTYRDSEGAVQYAWTYTGVSPTGYAVAVLFVPADADVQSVDAEGFDERRNSLWWSGFRL